MHRRLLVIAFLRAGIDSASRNPWRQALYLTITIGKRDPGACDVKTLLKHYARAKEGYNLHLDPRLANGLSQYLGFEDSLDFAKNATVERLKVPWSAFRRRVAASVALYLLVNGLTMLYFWVFLPWLRG